MKPALVGAMALAILLVLPLRSPPSVLQRSVVPLPGTTRSLARLHQGSRGGASALLRTVPVANAGVLAVDERTNRVFVTRESVNAGLVSVLDAQSGALLRTVRVGAFPGSVVIDAATGRAFVATAQGVSVLNARQGTVLQTVRLSDGAARIVVAERARHVFVTGATVQSRFTLVHMLDARSGALLHTIRVGAQSAVVAAAERSGQIVVATYTADTVSMIDARTGEIWRTVRVGQRPVAAAVDESTGHVFVVAGGSPGVRATVSMLDARTGRVVRTTLVNANPQTVAIDTQTRRVFVPTADTVDVLDVHSGALIHSINARPMSTPISLPPTGRIVELAAGTSTASGADSTASGCVACLLVLDGRTGAVRRRHALRDVRSYGLYTLAAADTRTHRVFVLEGDAVAMFDATHL